LKFKVYFFENVSTTVSREGHMKNVVEGLPV
jgi:hypothetical protein